MGKPRIKPPKLGREMGKCSVCPDGREASVEIITIEHPDAPKVEVSEGTFIPQWFGFCLRCARLVAKEAARG